MAQSTIGTDYDHLFKILCVGNSAVGKSSLVNRCKPSLIAFVLR